MTSNSKKIKKNIIFGIGSQLLIAIVGIIIPKLFITNYGSEVNGFLSSINQVFSYIVLLEAGVGTATLQALFKPIAENDREKINGVLSATNQFYIRTGWYYLGCVVLLAALYPLVVKSAIPVWQQVAVILIVGSSGAIGYFFHAKFRMLLQADGKLYVFSGVYTIVQLGTSFTKVIMILLGMNIVFVQLGHLVLMAALSLFIMRYTRRHYSWINLKVKSDKAAISQKRSVLVHEVSLMIFNHTDVLLLTLFTNLKVVSVYTLYNMIVDIISNLINNTHNGFAFRLGQVFNTNELRYKETFNSYETCYMAMSVALYCITYIFLHPFLRIYMGGVTDINYLDPYLPALFVCIKLLVSGRALAGETIKYAGHFKKTQWRSVLESAINLVVSISAIFVFSRYNPMYGMYGALLGTIVALLYRATDMILYTRCRILHDSPWKTFSKWLVNLLGFGIMLLISRFVPIQAENYFMLVLYAIGYTITAAIVFGALNFLFFRKYVSVAAQYLFKTMLYKFKKRRC